MSEKIIYVYENWSDTVPNLMGKLYVHFIRGKEQVAFEYDNNWLTSAKGNFSIDPDLYYYRGRQHLHDSKMTFGIFADSAPDRWGRLLMRRREAIQARKEERKARTLFENDYLLGVYDKARMGALRFKTEEEGTFLADDEELATPPWTTLRSLEAASFGFENDESGLEEKWLKQLLAPGSSLGGARPKATVADEKGELWIAKFPSKHDEYNSGAWEFVVHKLALLCGLDVPEARLETFSKNGSTFLVKRFDRDGDKRLHFASAMTMLGKTDGAEGCSYLDLVSFLREQGSKPQKDLQELWKRILFNMAVSNTDDHLRNHGFILEKNGWRLSPLYDVNPIPFGDSLYLCVDEESGVISEELLLDVATYFGLNRNVAIGQIVEVKRIVRENWRALASKYGISRSACEQMQPAFDFCNL